MVRPTPWLLGIAAWIDSRGVIAGSAVETDWRRRSTASTSTGRPGNAESGLVTVCQPGCGVAMLTTVSGAALISPSVVHVAVTVICPPNGIITLGGKAQLKPCSSVTTPL